MTPLIDPTAGIFCLCARKSNARMKPFGWGKGRSPCNENLSAAQSYSCSFYKWCWWDCQHAQPGETNPSSLGQRDLSHDTQRCWDCPEELQSVTLDMEEPPSDMENQFLERDNIREVGDGTD